MITTLISRFCAVFGLLAFALLPVLSHDYKIGELKIDHPWTRATPGGAKVGGGYMKITNTGSETDRLIGGSAEIAGILEIHEMAMDGNVMKMRALEKGLEIKAGASVELKPGGYHVMFIDLKKPLKEGEKIKGNLIFEKAGKVDVEYRVESRGGTMPSGDHDHGKH
jgi:periplasmic copper chaperone A